MSNSVYWARRGCRCGCRRCCWTGWCSRQSRVSIWNFVLASCRAGIEDIRFGDEVPGVVGNMVKGAKSVHALPGGKQVFVECVDGGDRAIFCQRRSSWDARTLPIDLDALGRPDCSLKEVAKKSEEKTMSWVLTGPRTARWCISYLVTEGLGFEAHHERFRQLGRIEASSWGAQEHFQLSMIAKHALQTDQLNGYNSMFCEVIFRRLQTIEFAYAERAREAEAKAIGGRLSLEEQQTFGGLTRQASTLMVCPELMDYVKPEVERDASLSKNLRKAREERELARKQSAKGKKTGEDAPWVGAGRWLWGSHLPTATAPFAWWWPEAKGHLSSSSSTWIWSWWFEQFVKAVP